MVPTVVIDTETTGFPSTSGGFRARIIEIGAVVITADRRVVSPISFFVRQPRSHLKCWQAKKAMGVHGIPIHTVLEEGLDETEAAPRLARWVERVRDRFGIEQVRAYNQPFDFWFLEQSPWDFFERTGLAAGEDIMQTARRAMACKAGPRLQKAVDFLCDRGKHVSWHGTAHRAGEDARMAAELAVHFEQLAEN